MTTKEVKLWGEYKKYIEKHNEPYRKAVKEFYKELSKKEEEKKKLEEERYKRALEKWGRSWFTKLSPKPLEIEFYTPYSFYTSQLTEMHLLSLAMMHKKMDGPTWEGFLNWRLKKNKLKEQEAKCSHGTLAIHLYGKLLRAEGEIMMLQEELKAVTKKLKKVGKFFKSVV